MLARLLLIIAYAAALIGLLLLFFAPLAGQGVLLLGILVALLARIDQAREQQHDLGRILGEMTRRLRGE